MRISSKQMHMGGVRAILDQQSQLVHTQNQIATGKRVLKPSDDPVASSRVLNLEQAKAITERYQLNADAAGSRLNIEESVLDDINTQLTRVRELAIQGNNDSQSEQSRRMIASEVNQILEHLIEVANTQDNNGEYLFAGYQGDTKPFARNPDGTFAYNGDEGRRYIQVGPTRRVADSDSGTEVFRDIKNGNGTFVTRDVAGNQGSAVIGPGNVFDPGAYDGDSYTLHMAMVTPAVADGVAGTVSDDPTTVDAAIDYQLTINGTTITPPADNPAPFADLSVLADEINAASAGVTAYVDSGSNQLYLESDTPGEAISITETLINASDPGDSVIGYFGSTLTGDEPSQTIELGAPTNRTAADSYVVVDSLGNVEASGAYQENSRIAFNGIEMDFQGTPENGDQFTVTPSVNQDIFTLVQNLSQALQTQSDAELHNSVSRVLADLELADEHVRSVRADVGARLSALDSQKNINEEFNLQIEEALSTIQDLDYAKAITDMNLQLTSLQAAQNSFVKVQGLSLFNYIR